MLSKAGADGRQQTRGTVVTQGRLDPAGILVLFNNRNVRHRALRYAVQGPSSLTLGRTFNLELGLPLTGLDKYEDLVGLPNFAGPYSQDDYLANQASHFQEHFASQIALRRLSSEFHRALTTGRLIRYHYPSALRPYVSRRPLFVNDRLSK